MKHLREKIRKEMLQWRKWANSKSDNDNWLSYCHGRRQAYEAMILEIDNLASEKRRNDNLVSRLDNGR